MIKVRSCWDIPGTWVFGIVQAVDGESPSGRAANGLGDMDTAFVPWIFRHCVPPIPTLILKENYLASLWFAVNVCICVILLPYIYSGDGN